MRGLVAQPVPSCPQMYCNSTEKFLLHTGRDSLEKETQDREPHTHVIRRSRKEDGLPDSKELETFAQDRGGEASTPGMGVFGAAGADGFLASGRSLAGAPRSGRSLGSHC